LMDSGVYTAGKRTGRWEYFDESGATLRTKDFPTV
jgi:hypothetical protein